jgi:3',5'-cyclic AMP phosphodiesterase CpdA
MPPYVLAHLSDPHLAPLPRARLSEIAGKRITGYINWRRRRHKIHIAETLNEIVRDLKAQAPDHIAVTGDLANISLPAEFPIARAWLDALGAPADVTFVPGNHDAYVREAANAASLHWAPFMEADAHSGAIEFPFVRRRGPLALIGLSTAVPTPPFMATGELGSAQLARLATMLARLANEPLFRVVLIHHPPVSAPAGRHKRLTDSQALRDVLAQHGADLLLHGHDHVHSVVWLDGPKGRIPAIGVPSASAALGGKHDPAAYNLYRIDGAPGAWTCEIVSRGIHPGGGVSEIKRMDLF